MPESTSPWRFLSALDGNEQADRELVLRTRADELEIVSNMISAARASLLYSYSGNGKSSLLNAGIVPRFLDRGYGVFKTRPRPPWSINNPTEAFKDCVLRDAALPLFGPGDLDLLKETRTELQRSEAGDGPRLSESVGRLQRKIERLSLRTDLNEVRGQLEKDRGLPLHEFVGQVQALLDPETRLLFVCDQFEELFVHYGNSPEMQEFVGGLGDVWKDSHLNVRILFSMREDWVGSMIEFRSAIPEVFTHSYKLKPLQQSRAGAVLEFPLKRLNVEVNTETRNTILADLARSYSINQENRFNDISLTPSPAQDPFVELPALQIVADELWDTRDRCATAFSLEHYRELPRLAGGVGVPADAGLNGSSPADWVLDHYLPGLLDQLAVGDPKDARALRELRLDVLFLLTDRSRHRRALTAEALLRDLRGIRDSRLDLPSVDPTLLARAVGPLEKQRLVRAYPTVGGGKQYELAHDFAVRAVVAEWRGLERHRIEALAIRTREDEESKERLGRYATQEGRALLFLRAMSFLPVPLCLLAAGLLAFEPWSWSETAPVLVAAFALIALLTLPVAVLVRQPFSTSLGVGCLVVSAIVTGASPVSDFFGFRYELWLFAAFVATALGGIPVTLAGMLRAEERLRARPPAGQAIKALLAESVDMLALIGLGLAGALLARVAAGLIDPYQRIAPGFAVLGGLLWGGAVWVIRSSRRLRAVGTTSGLSLAGLRVAGPPGGLPDWGSSLRRQAQFLAWTLGNMLLLGVPWVLSRAPSVYLGRPHRGIYELGTGLDVQESDSRGPTPPWRFWLAFAVWVVLGAAALGALMVFEPRRTYGDVPNGPPAEYLQPSPASPFLADTALVDHFSPLTRQLARLAAQQYAFYVANSRYASSLEELGLAAGEGVDIGLASRSHGWRAVASMPGSGLTCMIRIEGRPIPGQALPSPDCH